MVNDTKIVAQPDKPEFVIDNSSLEVYRRCPRKFFFRHRLDWAEARPSKYLSFGSAFHRAMNVIWMGAAGECELKEAQDFRLMDEDSLIKYSIAAFCSGWMESCGENPQSYNDEMNHALGAHTVVRARQILRAYYHRHKDRMAQLALLSYEQPFKFPLFEAPEGTYCYAGIIDKLVQPLSGSEKLKIVEHKTTSQYDREKGFRLIFTQQFPNSQTWGYELGYQGLAPDVSLWIDATLVHKTVEHFQILPFKSNQESLESAAGDLRYWVNRIRSDQFLITSQIENQEDIITAFGRNKSSCWDFNSRCPYLSICNYSSQPHIAKRPPELITSKWDVKQELGV